ncbi:hypothetical protein H8959_011889 [Pygathrix nigripes]
MPKNAVVILRYGPYSAAGLPVEHHTFRLQGLQAVLARDGHEVILEKIDDWNVVELMVNEEVVFHCNIKDLEFGISSQQNSSCPSHSMIQGEVAVLQCGHWTLLVRGGQLGPDLQLTQPQESHPAAQELTEIIKTTSFVTSLNPNPQGEPSNIRYTLS